MPHTASCQLADGGVIRVRSLVLCALAACCALWFAACATRGPQANEAAVALAPPRASAGPLIALLPPGPEFVLLAQPRALMQAESARALWRTLVTEEREQAFRTRTGVDPREVEELVVIALGAEGYLLLARGAFDADAIVRAAGDRLAVRDVETDEPILRREGLAGVGRYAYAALDPHAILVAKDAEPALLASVLARLSDRQGVPLLETSDAEALYATHGSAPLLLLAPRALALEPGTAVALLMAEERALALSITPSATSLQITIALRGTFPDGIEHNLRSWAHSVGQSDLGRALGLLNFAEHVQIQRAADGVLAHGSIAATDLISGMRLLFFDGMREIFPAD